MAPLRVGNVNRAPEEWNRTHRDFKGSVNGQRYVLQMTTRGTTMVPVEIVKEPKK